MNTTGTNNTRKTMLIWLLLVAIFTASSEVARATEETFPVLQIGTRMYTNATITTKAKTYVFVMHSTGMETIKVQDLPRELQQQLGYLAPDVPQKAGEVAARSLKAPTPADPARYGLGGLVPWVKDTLSRIKALSNKTEMEHLREKLEASAKNGMPNLASMNPRLIYAALGIVLFVHLFFSYCSRLICLKTGNEPGVLIWLPVLQLIPLFRAAAMSPAWLLAYLVPFLGLVAQIRWSLKIAKARNKSVGVGILLLLPILNVFAFLYLAFSDGESTTKDKKEARRGLVLGAT